MTYALSMAEQSSKRRKKNEPIDTNELAFDIVQDLTSEEPRAVELEKNPAAVERGHRGGLKGGKKRAANLSKKRRSEIAKAAAQARWGTAAHNQ